MDAKKTHGREARWADVMNEFDQHTQRQDKKNSEFVERQRALDSWFVRARQNASEEEKQAIMTEYNERRHELLQQRK